MRPFVGPYSIVFAGCVRQCSLSSVDPGLAYCVLSNCLCTLCVFSIVSKSLGCDNSRVLLIMCELDRCGRQQICHEDSRGVLPQCSYSP